MGANEIEKNLDECNKEKNNNKNENNNENPVLRCQSKQC